MRVQSKQKSNEFRMQDKKEPLDIELDIYGHPGHAMWIRLHDIAINCRGVICRLSG